MTLEEKLRKSRVYQLPAIEVDALQLKKAHKEGEEVFPAGSWVVREQNGNIHFLSEEAFVEAGYVKKEGQGL